MGEHRPLENTAYLNMIKSSCFELKELYPGILVASEPLENGNISNVPYIFGNVAFFNL